MMIALPAIGPHTCYRSTRRAILSTVRTPEEHKRFFKDHRDELARAATQGPEAALGYLRGFPDPEDRESLALYARHALILGAEPLLDAYAAVARFGIDDALSREQLDAANVMSYNLAADLADCWPGDETQRTRSHFEQGLEAAKRCIQLREQLGAPADKLATAWWARGMHEISLGASVDAAESFARAVAIGTDGEFGTMLAQGYLGLARWIGGDEEARARYEGMRDLFEAQAGADDAELAEDARFGLEQLAKVARRYAPTS